MIGGSTECLVRKEEPGEEERRPRARYISSVRARPPFPKGASRPATEAGAIHHRNALPGNRKPASLTDTFWTPGPKEDRPTGNRTLLFCFFFFFFCFFGHPFFCAVDDDTSLLPRLYESDLSQWQQLQTIGGDTPVCCVSLSSLCIVSEQYFSSYRTHRVIRGEALAPPLAPLIVQSTSHQLIVYIPLPILAFHRVSFLLLPLLDKLLARTGFVDRRIVELSTTLPVRTITQITHAW